MLYELIFRENRENHENCTTGLPTPPPIFKVKHTKTSE